MGYSYGAPLAAQLTSHERCSDCNVKAVWAGERRELRVCPNCYSLLWHFDWSEAARLARERHRAEMAAHEEEVRALRQKLKDERQERRRERDGGQGQEGDGGVQAGEPAQRIEERPEGDEPQAGGGDRSERAEGAAQEAPTSKVSSFH